LLNCGACHIEIIVTRDVYFIYTLRQFWDYFIKNCCSCLPVMKSEREIKNMKVNVLFLVHSIVYLFFFKVFIGIYKNINI